MISTLLIAASAALLPQVLDVELGARDATVICGTAEPSDTCAQVTLDSFWVVRTALMDPKLGKAARARLTTIMAAQTHGGATYWAAVVNGWAGKGFSVPVGYRGDDPNVVKAASDSAWDIAHYAPPAGPTISATCHSYSGRYYSRTTCTVQ